MTTFVRRNSERLVIAFGVAAALGLGVIAFRPDPAQAQAASGIAAQRVAVADVLGITDRLLSTEKYTSGQRTQVEVLNRGLQPMQTELETLVAQYRGMDDTNPEKQPLGQSIGTKEQTFRQEAQRAQAQLEAFKTAQATEAYRLVSEAADKLASELGYSLVIASRTGPIQIRSDNVSGAIQEMLARPVIRVAAGDDLSDRLMKQFGLTDPPKATPVGDSTTPAPK
ncbi:MAG: hypothetical protein HBSAPP03_22980 [Phycisphaerae bacterium]|nr:MAG: hypothetical protein HBSAPP03_22980 [Phycisphaerae bacterium]